MSFPQVRLNNPRSYLWDIDAPGGRGGTWPHFPLSNYCTGVLRPAHPSDQYWYWAVPSQSCKRYISSRNLLLYHRWSSPEIRTKVQSRFPHRDLINTCLEGHPSVPRKPQFFARSRHLFLIYTVLVKTFSECSPSYLFQILKFLLFALIVLKPWPPPVGAVVWNNTNMMSGFQVQKQWPPKFHIKFRNIGPPLI